ncbi:hypothetical protein [Prosthecodimorpha staleyi]|uniref:Uncharacterized protein n=1 Tax=Prosthecodimorpha staleyi TaxID=2840188 RepID=A0A947G9E0_9HYPH|nr:hypothetical protein [Prosthecodimorpha staleyi]MBT9287853.1 hypothetical protein [Prosthecodimorpha staleyi]
MAGDETPKSILLQRWEAERAAASARTEAWLRGLFEEAAGQPAEAPPPKPVPEATRRLRAMLAVPAASDLRKILAARFMLATRSRGRPAYDGINRGARVYQAVTDPSASSYLDDRYVPVTGAELFQRVAEDDKVDGVLIDDDKRCEPGDVVPRRNLLLSPGFCAGALEGLDRRPGIGPMQARSRAEIELWLDLHFFPTARQALEATRPDGSRLLRFHADSHYLPWSCVETADVQGTDIDIWSPVFELSAEDAARGPGDFGDRPSGILCPGLLAARKLRGTAPGTRLFGTFLGIGRLHDGIARREAAMQAAAAGEMSKLIPPEAATVPRTAFLTVEGAAEARRRPDFFTRRGIEAERVHGLRHARIWSWGR